MYWLPKLYKTPIRARFIMFSKNCSTKLLSKVISEIFKIIFKHVENFHNKSPFYSSYKKFRNNTFCFKSKVRSKYGFPVTSLYCTSKGLGRRYFMEKNLIVAVTFLIKKCYFTIGNMVLKKDIGIPTSNDPAPI